MSLFDRWDRRNREAIEKGAKLHRVATAPDGSRYEVVGEAADWRLGTGSIVLDALAFVWALWRQARGKEWSVSVRPTGTAKQPVATRFVRTREEAEEVVDELSNAVESGRLAQID
jgi:hypothetical protein